MKWPTGKGIAWAATGVICGGTVLGLLLVRLLHGGVAEDRGSAADPTVAGSTIEISATAWFFISVLVVLRVVWLAKRRAVALQPVIDLPLFSYLVAATGTFTSPLDPSLLLVYGAALVLLCPPAEEAEEGERLLGLMLGLGAMIMIVRHYDGDRWHQVDQRARGQRREATRELREGLATGAESLVVLFDQLEESPAPHGPPLRPAEQAWLESLRAPLIEVQHFLNSCGRSLAPFRHRENLEEFAAELQQGIDRAFDRYFAARDEGRPDPVNPVLQEDADSLDMIRQSQASIRQELFSGLDRLGQLLDVQESFQERDAERRDAGEMRFLLASGIVVAFVALGLRLREQLERSLRERGAREVAAREAETHNWIALTAGLTHGLGNDVLAYDAYLGELLQLLPQTPASDERARATEVLEFLRDSNRGRLGFLQFLQAFAEQRKAGTQRPALPDLDLDVPALLERVRQHLGRVESANLPPAGSDPAVDRQLRKFRELPLQVESGSPEAARVRRGHTGVLEFFAYELLKNALRSASGERPLRMELERADGQHRWTLFNDVLVDPSSGNCGVCGAGPRELRQVRRRRDVPSACESCFADQLQQVLTASFEPGTGGGTGLGLFLMRYFVESYYGGQLSAGVANPKVPVVYFALSFPAAPESTDESPHE